jgi:hypothetical protein
MRFLMIAVLSGLALAPMSAAAECSCLCLDGSYQPVCTSAEEVGPNRGLCQAQASQGCPTPTQAAELERYDAPVDGVANCRQAQVYDAAAGDHVMARVCDVAPAD